MWGILTLAGVVYHSSGCLQAFPVLGVRFQREDVWLHECADP
jgi:hypothetical protein